MTESKKEFCVWCDRKLKVNWKETFAGAEIFGCSDCNSIVIRFNNEKFQQIYRDIARAIKYNHKSILEYYTEEHNLYSSLMMVRNSILLLNLMEKANDEEDRLKTEEFFIFCIAALVDNCVYQNISEELRNKIRTLRNLSDEDFHREYPNKQRYEVFYDIYEKIDNEAIKLSKETALKTASPILKKHGEFHREIEEILGYMFDFLSENFDDFTIFTQRHFKLGNTEIPAGRLITLSNILIASEKLSFSQERVKGFNDIFKDRISDPFAAASWLKHHLIYSSAFDYNQMTYQLDFHIPENSSLGDLEFYRKAGEWIKAEIIGVWTTGIILMDIADSNAVNNLSYDFPIPDETIPEDFHEDHNLKIPRILQKTFPDINKYLSFRIRKLKESFQASAEKLGIDPSDSRDVSGSPENFPIDLAHMEGEILDQMDKIYHGSMFESMQALKEQVSDATASIDRYLETHPNDTSAMLEAANFLNITKETEKSLSYLKRILAIEPDNIKALELTIQRLTDMNRKEEAQNYIKRILKTDPKNFTANMHTVAYLIKNHQLDEALTHLDKITTHHPKESRPWFMKATAYAEKRDFETCLSCIDKAIELDPDIDFYYLEQGIAYFALNRLDEAEKALLKVLQINPDDFSAIHSLGGLYLIKEDNKLAHKYLKKSMQLNSSHIPSMINYGILLDSEGKPEEAMEIFLSAFEKSPDNIALLQAIGKNLVNRREYDEACRYFGKILELDPENFETLYMLGTANTHLKNYEKALDCCDRALNIKPDNSNLLCCKAWIFQEQDNPDSALEAYEAATKVKKGDPLIWFYQGQIYHQKNELEKAYECFNKALELMPDDPDFLLAVGTVRMDMGNLEEAAGYLERSIKSNPDNDETIYNLACVYARLGRKPDMLEKLHEAVKMNDEWKEVAIKDEDFRDYLEDEEFREILK